MNSQYIWIFLLGMLLACGAPHVITTEETDALNEIGTRLNCEASVFSNKDLLRTTGKAYDFHLVLTNVKIQQDSAEYLAQRVVLLSIFESERQVRKFRCRNYYRPKG